MDKFDMEAVARTFLNTKSGELHSGVVVIKRADGVIFNIGGKRDAFIPREDFENFEEIKIGDRFQVVVTKSKNDEGMIEASKSKADVISIGIQNAQKIKLGSVFTFVPTQVKNGLVSKLGNFDIFVPKDQVSDRFVDLNLLIGKQQEAIATEIDRENKMIVASIKLLQQQEREQNEKLFWSSIFINKIVKGTVKKILPYGAFVEVDGVDCFIHISDLSYDRVDSPNDVISVGQTLNFKVIELDREAKKIKLGLKQILPDPTVEKIEKLKIGEVVEGEVQKLLPFGAIVKLENGLKGLMHISTITERRDVAVHEFVHIGDKIKVEVLDKNSENKKLSFKFVSKM